MSPPKKCHKIKCPEIKSTKIKSVPKPIIKPKLKPNLKPKPTKTKTKPKPNQKQNQNQPKTKNKTKNKKTFPDYLLIGDIKIHDKNAIANQFKNYFANIGPKLSSEITNTSQKSISSFLQNTITTSFSFEATTPEKVKDVIHKLKSKSSTGYDSVSTYLLKRISHIILIPLTCAINQSLSTGIFPDHLKIAKVIPLFKKDDPICWRITDHIVTTSNIQSVCKNSFYTSL